MSEPIITPTVMYQDPKAALAWLERAFGFEIAMLLTDAQNNIAHAEMAYEGARIGVAGEWEAPLLGGARMRSPKTLDGMATQFLWLTVFNDIDGHCARARAAGAQIAQEPEDQFYGARVYRARDPEGHVWCFRQALRDVSEAEMSAATGLVFKDKLD